MIDTIKIYTEIDKNTYLAIYNTSIILKVTFCNTNFLFTGDATDKTEEKILNQDLSSTVLKVGHHGSRYSTTNKFLKKVNPEYAIISVGEGNSYKHPHKETLDKFKKYGTKVYRTDELGTIMVYSDGDNITITSEKTNTNGG